MTWAPVRFFWQHSLHDLTATSQQSGYDVSNLLNSLETDYWKGTSINTQTIIFDAGSGQAIIADYFAIAQHNLNTAGGFVELQTFSSHIIYLNNWTEIQCGATRRYRHSAVIFSNDMYVFGGINYQGSRTNDLWKYSFTNCVWTEIQCGATRRYGHSSVAFSDAMYVFGGINSSGNELNDLWKYSFTNCVWTEIQCGATRRSRHSSVAFSDAMYVFGGVSYQNSELNDLWKYSFTNCVWTEIQCGATRRQIPHSAAVFSNAMYVFGGYGQSSYLNDLWKYSFTNCVWTEIQCGPRRYGNSAVVFSDAMYVFGGVVTNSYFNDLWEYSFTKCVWTEIQCGATRRYSHSAVIFSDAMYVFGGFERLNGVSSYVNDLWKTLLLPNSIYIDASSSYYGPTLPPDDNMLLALVNSASQQAWRMIVSSIQAIPWIAIAQWGMKQELGMHIDVKTDPHRQERHANINVSQTGYLQGIHEYYTERRIDLSFSSQDSSAYSGVTSWWDGSRLRNFFMQWDSAVHSSEIWLVHPEPTLEAPMKVGGLYRDIKLKLLGRRME